MSETVSLALLRGSIEHLYDHCSKALDNSLYDCALCPLHCACVQARGEQYTSLRDLMGTLLYWIQKQAEKESPE